MKKRLLILSLVGLVFAAPAFAATPVYSHVVVSSNASIATGGTGAPDGVYAEVVADNGYVEFGFPQTSTYDIRKVYIYENPNSVLANRPWIKIEFMNLATVVRTSWQRVDGSTPTGNLSTYIGDEPFDRVRFTKLSGDPLRIDSVWLEAADVEEAPEPIPTPTPEPESEASNENAAPPTTSETSSGNSTTESTVNSAFPRLVKLPDDGDPSTQYDTAVYAIDSDDGKRRPFFNETIYFSWFTDFSRVEVISAQEMATLPLGKPMWMHQGTWLVKVQSTNDVYAVERGGVLRRIPSELAAAYFYGPDWRERVRDISPTDWPHYTVGADVSEVHANDSIIRDVNLVVWHMRNGMRRQIPETNLAFHGIQQEHIVDYGAILGYNTESRIMLDVYPIGAMYSRTDDFGWWDF